MRKSPRPWSAWSEEGRKKNRQKVWIFFSSQSLTKKDRKITEKIKFRCDKNWENEGFTAHSRFSPLQSTTRTALVCNNRMLWKKERPATTVLYQSVTWFDKKIMDAWILFLTRSHFGELKQNFGLKNLLVKKLSNSSVYRFVLHFYNIHTWLREWSVGEKFQTLLRWNGLQGSWAAPPPESAIIHHCVPKIMTDRTLFCGRAGR